ncbi:MAG: hypothetical protein IAG13_06905 [Deltaproteobacteria bacterium]|nr:hypothetical protein [Nannocystaceae bacterium]
MQEHLLARPRLTLDLGPRAGAQRGHGLRARTGIEEDLPIAARRGVEDATALPLPRRAVRAQHGGDRIVPPQLDRRRLPGRRQLARIDHQRAIGGECDHRPVVTATVVCERLSARAVDRASARDAQLVAQLGRTRGDRAEQGAVVRVVDAHGLDRRLPEHLARRVDELEEHGQRRARRLTVVGAERPGELESLLDHHVAGQLGMIDAGDADGVEPRLDRDAERTVAVEIALRNRLREARPSHRVEASA